MNSLLNDNDMIDRIFSHIDNKTTDLGEKVWREPVTNYLSEDRFNAEIELLKSTAVPFCPSAALPENGSYIARKAAGTPLIVVRGEDGLVRAFINACRHRGMQVAKDSGCARAFVCPYHAWTYGLDGHLKHVPGKDGFPDLDPKEHGLVEVSASEKGGLVYVNQKGVIDPEVLENIPDFFSPEQKFFKQVGFSDDANWKLIAETSMEGYHIKSLHKKSFFPYGLDNTNIVETFGPCSRITFPFRRIKKLRDVKPEERNIDGLVTTVYQLFPNAQVSILSKHSSLVILEPISPTCTEHVVYQLTNKGHKGVEISLEEAERDASFVKDSGLDEDRAAACAIQESLLSNANSHLTFGRFEKAIVHFHKNLTEALS